MPPRSVPGLGALLTTLLLVGGLLAPTAASAAPTGTAATFGDRGSAFAGESVRAASTAPIEVRDLSFACPAEDGRLPSSGFVDVHPGSTFERAIDCLLWYEITQGVTATTYGPGHAVTRQQMAVFIYRTLEALSIADLVAAPSRSQFDDVPATGEVGRAINVLASQELAGRLGVQIVTGKTADTFDPRGHVTRAQMGSFIARTLEGVAAYNGVRIDRGRCDDAFRDEASIPTVHAENVKLLCAFGIVAGRTDGTYGPEADVTRGQMAAFLMRLMDVLVEAKVAYPPDAYATVYVDRGSAPTACSDEGRDGTQARPFCTIQRGINHSRTLQSYVVTVLVRPRATPYTGAVVLSNGDAFAVDLDSMDEPVLVPLEGSIRIDGSSHRDSNSVAGFDVVSASTALDVRSPGVVRVGRSRFQAPTAVSMDQTGFTWLVRSHVDGSSVGVDLVDTRLQSSGWATFLGGNEFAPSSQAYVRTPRGALEPTASRNLRTWLNDAENRFPSGAVIDTSDGRRAIVPGAQQPGT